MNMPDLTNVSLFMLAAVMLNLTPGADMMYVAARSTSQGRKAGIISALGIAGGTFVHITGAVIGISALIAQSALAFEIIKYLGAAYLVYLGIKSIIKKEFSSTELKSPGNSPGKIFSQGVITNVLNPKVALFFLAFIPQFINPSSDNYVKQIVFLGTLFNLSGTIVNITVALVFSYAGNKLSSFPLFRKIQQKISGIILIGLGLRIALLKQK